MILCRKMRTTISEQKQNTIEGMTLVTDCHLRTCNKPHFNFLVTLKHA